MAHVFPRGGGMRSVGHRVVHANATAIEVHSIEFLDAACGIFDCCHLDETETSRTIGLPLIINDSNFFDPTKPAKFLVQVTLLGADAQTEHPEYVRGIGRLNWGMRRPPGSNRRPTAEPGASKTAIATDGTPRPRTTSRRWITAAAPFRASTSGRWGSSICI